MYLTRIELAGELWFLLLRTLNRLTLRDSVKEITISYSVL